MAKPNKITLLVQFRPLCTERSIGPMGKIVQLEDGRWQAGDAEPLKVAMKYRIPIDDSIRMLNKNSSFKYNIIVVIDSDVYPNNTFLKEFDNVTIMKSKFVLRDTRGISASALAALRINHALNDAIQSLPDEEWIGYSFMDDVLYPKNWDEGIIKAIESMGDEYVYAPYMVEIGPRPAHAAIPEYIGELTFQNIWEMWRTNYGKYELIHPPTKRGYLIYEDLENFVNIAKRENIIEICGVRNYGFFAQLFLKNKYAKKAMPIMGHAFDIHFDSNLGHAPGGLGLKKVVVGTSFIFHPSMEYRDINKT